MRLAFAHVLVGALVPLEAPRLVDAGHDVVGRAVALGIWKVRALLGDDGLNVGRVALGMDLGDSPAVGQVARYLFFGERAVERVVGFGRDDARDGLGRAGPRRVGRALLLEVKHEPAVVGVALAHLRVKVDLGGIGAVDLCERKGLADWVDGQCSRPLCVPALQGSERVCRRGALEGRRIVGHRLVGVEADALGQQSGGRGIGQKKRGL